MSKQFYSQYINRLRVPKFTDKGFENTENDSWHLSDLKPINIFIGANNSGKSRLIRHLFSHDISDIDSDKFPVSRFFDMPMSTERKTKPVENRTDFSKLNEGIDSNENLSNQNIFGYLHSRSENILIDRYSGTSESDIKALHQEYITSTQNNDDFTFIADYRPQDFKKIYIPLLRGLRTLRSNIDDFHDRTMKDYFAKHNENVTIFTGHSLYNDLKNSLLGTYEERNKVRDFENYLSENFFNNKSLSLVPRVNDDVVYLKEGDKPERPIYDLGDGLQAVIILTFNVFMATEPTMFFIEEPEQHLHASMQRSLIEAYSSHPKHMYFITTHSNHFIDLSQETDNVGIQRVYQQIENDVETTIIESASKDVHILADLGVRASSVLLANCSIWVEGITDKLYLRAYMDKFISELDDTGRAEKLRNYKENLHFIFTEYQGSNITHWDFSDSKTHTANSTPARSVTSNIMLIADEDIDGKGDRVSELREALGVKFELLNVKEIENLIPDVILTKAAKEQWESKNNRIKYSATFSDQDITQASYSNTTGIGLYLESLVNKTLPENSTTTETNTFNAYSYFAEKSGTIKAKVAFCNIATKHMNSGKTEWELTDGITALCENIWSHIEVSNR